MIANITAPLAIGQSSSYYTLKEAYGFGSATVEVSKWDRPGFHGIKTPRAFWRERLIRLIVGVRSSTSADYETRRRALEAAFDTPRDGLTWLKFVTQGATSLQTQVHLNSEIQGDLLPGEVTMGEFRIELIAEDPVLYSQTQTTTSINLSAGSGTVTNNGNSAVYPTVRVYGNVTNPVITNTTLGKTVSLTGITIAAGNYIDFNMLNETIKDQSGNRRYSYINSDDFWWLKEGANTITVSGTIGGSGERKVSVIYRDGYIGI
jgi:hypothetical protein